MGNNKNKLSLTDLNNYLKTRGKPVRLELDRPLKTFINGKGAANAKGDFFTLLTKGSAPSSL
jgi:hypothetical protein